MANGYWVPGYWNFRGGFRGPMVRYDRGFDRHFDRDRDRGHERFRR
jgi:hypothetical protein